nr:hypothetical protein GCM10025732_31980 [Glycomyces mayteni]
MEDGGVVGGGAEAPERAAKDAAGRDLVVEFVPRDPVTGAPAAQGVMGVKTIVLRSRDGFVLVLVPYEDRFSWPKLRAVLGVNKMKLPTAEEAFAATGYRRGTITPLGAAEVFPVLADERLRGRQIVIGSGSRTSPPASTRTTSSAPTTPKWST